MKSIIVIPARYASTRFPGKPLAMLGGKSVIRRVYEQSSKVAAEVCVATDDERIFNHVCSWGGKVVMTRTDHKSGTDRIEEAVEKLEQQGNNYDIVVNVQGDEPFIQPLQISNVIDCFEDPETQIATLAIPFGDNTEAVSNPNSPKIVMDLRGFAMYFSRSIIPYCRNIPAESWAKQFPYLKHIGLYAYRREVLREVTQLGQSPLEIAESLEQLRWLQHGYRIKVATTDSDTVGIDTPEDLKKAEERLTIHNSQFIVHSS